MDDHPAPDIVPRAAQRRSISPSLTIFGAFCISFFLYLATFALPYNLFTYVEDSPLSMPEIAERKYLPAAIFLLTFLTLFALYALVYRICRRRPGVWSAGLIILSGLGLALALSLTYPIGAGDVIDYVSYGEELAFMGANPLVTPPVQVEGGAFTHYSAYRYTTSNYGPVFTWISALVVRVMGRDSLALNLLGFKAVAIAAYLIQAVLIYAILRRRHPDFATAGLVLFAWNPLILYEFAANAHNDATMMAFAILGIFFWDRRQPLLMSLALTASLLVKIPTAPLLPLFVLAAARREGSSRRFWATLIGCGLVAALLVAAAYLSLPDSREALTNLSGRSDLFTHSLPTIVNNLLQLCSLEEPTAKAIARTAALAALITWYLIQLWRTWKEPWSAPLRAYNTVLFLLLFTTLWFQPWYVTWLVALSALRPRGTAPSQAALFSSTVLISYVIYGFVWFWIPEVANWGRTLGINLMAVATSFAAPWAYTAWLWIKRSGGSETGHSPPKKARD